MVTHHKILSEKQTLKYGISGDQKTDGKRGYENLNFSKKYSNIL